ncbi:MAG: Ig-like domain-containing protein [Kofleriaceae bacterium]|nr:Ig-like domain-containing protein [Myxococcales bacterium]MCB9558869.1 Ig-like domain-containing protein [Kofleriaceae bacterium]MCB9570574.1 Ig-like domain-containing protein [Kofleriaceae bacterium]
MRYSLEALVLSTVLAACGEVASVPDDGGGDPVVDAAPGDVDAPASDVTLVASTPADGATAVDVTTAITLTFSDALDADSVAGAVHVFERESRREVPVAAASWDAASRTVTVTLARPLDLAGRYRVEATGLRAAGLAVAMSPVRFHTFVNSATHYRGYGSGGVVNYRIDYQLDGEGFPAVARAYAAGADGAYDTGDDVVTIVTVATYADGDRQGAIVYDSAGADGVWGTADDHGTSRSAYTYGPAGLVRGLLYDGAGADGVWGTADDVPSFWYTGAYDDLDRPARYEYFAGPGPDGALFTADDVRDSYSITEHPTPALTEFRDYDDPGPDGVWDTTDDHLARRIVTDLDDVGRPTRWRSYDGQGALTQYQLFTYDAAGLLVRVVRSYSPGVDGVWQTPDDPISSYDQTSYDARHLRTRTVTRDTGADNRIGNADDHDLWANEAYDTSY